MENRPPLFHSLRLQELLIALIGMAITFAVWSQRYRFPFDDSFITFRYAQHLAEWKGLVWNIGGPHTEGYTNFLYVVLLAPSFWLGIDPLMWAWCLNIIALIASAIIIHRLTALLLSYEFQNRESLLPFAMSILFLFTPLVWMNALSDMETTVFGFFLLASALSFARSYFSSSENSFLLPFIFAFLAALTRPEGALLGAVFCLVLILTQRDKWKEALAFVIPLVLYHLWRFIYFGKLLPNSFMVKVMNQGATTIFQGRAYVISFALSTIGLMLATIFSLRSIPKKRVTSALILFCALTLCFYLFPSPVMGLYDRFLYSVSVFLYVLAALGLWILTRERLRVVRFVIVALFGIVQVYASLKAPRPVEAFGSTDIDFHYYTRVAQILHDLPSHDSISFAFADAGIIPFYSGVAQVDLVGLNDNMLAEARTFPDVAKVISLRSPDLIFVPINQPRPEDDSCRHVFRAGHGVIGSHYIDLVNDQRFSDYRSLITFHAWNYDIVAMERLHSRFAREIEAGFMSHLTSDSDLLVRAPGCLN